MIGNFVEVLKAAEAAGGSGSKKVIQAALATLDQNGRRLMRFAMDPYTTFYVKKFDQPKSFAAVDGPIEAFFEVLENLAAKKLRGNAGKEAVTRILGTFTQETALYLERVIDKDPRGGFSAETFNCVLFAKATGTDVDAVKKDISKNGIDKYRALPIFSEVIPSWDEQLAEKCEDFEDFEVRIQFPARADVKYDGNRQFAFIKDGNIEWRARGGKPSDHLEGVFDEELLKIREKLGYDYVLDGEVMAASFTETQNAKKGGSDKSALVFRAFFIMPITDWVSQKTAITNREALETIRQVTSDLKKIQPTVGKIVNDVHEMMEYCNSVIDDDTKTQAEREGLIVKNLDAVYEWGRSYAWIKVKRFYDVDARFISFYEAKPKTRLEKLGLYGGVNCVAFLESGERVEFNVGSGFSFEQRKDMRNNPEKWLKGTHVIKYQEISKAKGKEVRSLRFCTYEHSRDDKLVEI